MGDFKRARRAVALDWKPSCTECTRQIKLMEKYFLTAGESVCKECFKNLHEDHEYLVRNADEGRR